MLSNKEIKFYQKNGYLIKRNFLSQKIRNNFFKSFLEICFNYGKKYFKINNIKDWDSPSFNNGLINLRKKNPKVFSKIYDVVQVTAAINKIVYFGKLNIISSKLLKIKKDTACEIASILRMDPPFDNKNSLGWHEEGCYNNRINDSVVTWCPMVNVNEINGTMDIILNSHKSKKIVKSKYSKKIISKYKIKSMKLKAGDILIMDSKIVHKSGSNSSKKLRFTLSCRWNKLPNVKMKFGSNLHY